MKGKNRSFGRFVPDLLRDALIKIIVEQILKLVYRTTLQTRLKNTYRSWFRTYRFVVWKVDGKIAGSKPEIKIMLTRDTHLLAVYKRRIFAPFWHLYYAVINSIVSVNISN